MDYVFITGWTHGQGQGGLNQYRFDSKTGGMEFMCNYCPEVSFGTVFFNKDKKVIYAIEEAKDLNGGFVHSFSIDPETGNLTYIDKAYTLAPNPAYLGIDKSGRFAVVADHSFDAATVKIKKDGNGLPYTEKVLADAAIVLFEICEDGSLGKAVDACVHTGTSIAPRQNMPHPHCAVFSPNGRFCAVCDKGNDYVYMYRVNTESEKLELVTSWKETPGFKPRYAVWHPTKPFFYHNNEGSGMVDAYSYDENDTFTRIGEYLTVPGSGKGRFEQQGLCIHPDGTMLYNVERTSAKIAVFRIDQETGELTLVQNIGKDYEWLRGIKITEDGKFLIATYMNSAKTVVFAVQSDGTLEDTGFEYDCPNCAGIEVVKMSVDHTLCYNPEDGKFHIGIGCGEKEEKFVGKITDKIADVTGYTGDGLNLTLKDFSFTTTAEIAMALPNGTVLNLKGTNTIKVSTEKEDANVGVLYSSGDLTINGDKDCSLAVIAETDQGLWSRAICARAGDLTINGGVITARGGKAKKSCGIYAGGHLWIEIGDKGKISINGGRLNIISGRNAIRAAEGLLYIAPEAHVKNVIEYDGKAEFHGDCISPVDIETAVEISFN